MRPLCVVFSVLAPFVAACLVGCGSDPHVALGLSGNAFDFSTTVVSAKATRAVVTVTNKSAEAATLTENLSGDASFALDPDAGCGTTLVPGGICSVAVTFTPKAAGKFNTALGLTLASTEDSESASVPLTGTGVQLSANESQVSATGNPLVALYSLQPAQQGSVYVEFGTDTSYGKKTSSVATPADGSPVQILVAGMMQATTYHMRSVLTTAQGDTVTSADQTFTTGSFPAGMLPTLSATTTSGMTPQPGIELANASLSTTNSNFLQAYATDLNGNIIWGYNFPERPSANTIIQPIKLLSNGNLLMVISFASQYVLPGQGVTLTDADESVDMIREIDLAGNPVKDLTIDQLNAKLTAAGYSGMTLTDFHHDVTPLPNGHMIVIANMLKSYDNLTGYSGTTNVLGDVLVDLDPDWNVAWVWSEFDHLDVNRHPISFPDWTHTNAVVYSPSDGDLLVSMRHQSWIIKVDYADGKGTGDVLWKLGNGGDFTLDGGNAPQDWFYGEHDPEIVSTNSAGVFSLTMMDNGYGRFNADGTQCTTTNTAECYTTVPIYVIDESAKTATVTFRQTMAASDYSVWGGSTTPLANGDLEYDLCADPMGTGSVIREVTTGANPQTVWSMKETGANLYRAHRIPSLYPGVQW